MQYADTPYGYPLYNLDLVQAPCDWNQETIGSSNTAVCIIDSGIQTNHPDLAANIWVNNAEIPNNGIDDDGNGMNTFMRLPSMIEWRHQQSEICCSTIIGLLFICSVLESMLAD